jgi:hypothetical protein
LRLAGAAVPEGPGGVADRQAFHDGSRLLGLAASESGKVEWRRPSLARALRMDRTELRLCALSALDGLCNVRRESSVSLKTRRADPAPFVVGKTPPRVVPAPPPYARMT